MLLVVGVFAPTFLFWHLRLFYHHGIKYMEKTQLVFVVAIFFCYFLNDMIYFCIFWRTHILFCFIQYQKYVKMPAKHSMCCFHVFFLSIQSLELIFFILVDPHSSWNIASAVLSSPKIFVKFQNEIGEVTFKRKLKEEKFVCLFLF